MDWREYIPWARSRARRFTPTGILAYEDYAVIAELALWKAAQRHDGRCAEAFKGFAFGFIRNDI